MSIIATKVLKDIKIFPYFLQANAVEGSYERLNPRAVLNGKNSLSQLEPSSSSQTLQQWLWFPYRHVGIIIITVYQVRVLPNLDNILF